ncbi:aminotransferase class I/II-fold pyridoxal phosphate-dependent enzyme [Rhodococcus koreensis]
MVHFQRMPIETEGPELIGYDNIAHNLAESSFTDLRLSDLGIDGDVSDLPLQYIDHRGTDELRVAIAADTVDPETVIATAGAAGALFLIAVTLLESGSHALICRPNYSSNLETPRGLGADIEHIELRFDNQWRLDIDDIARRLRPDTELVSICAPHNPTGQTITEEQLRALVALVENHGRARLLVDETYRELAYEQPLPVASSLSSRAISVSSMSKAYGLPGMRIGWLSTADSELYERILACKEQMSIAGSIVDETLAARVLQRREDVLGKIKPIVAERRDIVASWMERQTMFDWVAPQAGVVCFPRLLIADPAEATRFWAQLLDEQKTYVGPGRWFDLDERFFRLGFGWPSTETLQDGLDVLEKAASTLTRAEW